jgi:hypothetical protein
MQRILFLTIVADDLQRLHNRDPCNCQPNNSLRMAGCVVDPYRYRKWLRWDNLLIKGLGRRLRTRGFEYPIGQSRRAGICTG